MLMVIIPRIMKTPSQLIYPLYVGVVFNGSALVLAKHQVRVQLPLPTQTASLV